MSAVQCEKFVRNAWKKELCSNCFKSKEEHPEKPDRVHHVPVKLPDPPKHGILKGSKQTPPKPSKVAFPETEFEVIGYGGDDVYSDDDDLPAFQDKQTHDEPDTEQDREIQRLTRTNTEFNSVPTNLTQSTPSEPVRLGQKNRDDQGKKTPLLVSVTPFGGPTQNSQTKIRTTNPTMLVSDENVKPEKLLNQPTLDEGTTPKESREANLLDTVEPIKVPEVGIRRSHPIDKNSKFRPQKDDGVKNQLNIQTQQDNRVVSENKLNDKLTITASTKVANLLDKAKKKVNNLPVIGDANHFKFSTVNCKRPGDANKPVVLDMFKLGDETKKSEDADEKSLADVPKHQYLTKISPTIVFETKKSDDADRTIGKTILSSVTNVSSLHRSTVLELKINKDANGASNADSAIVETDTASNVCSTNAQFCQDIAICDKLDNYNGIIDGEEVTVFSLEKGKLENNAQTNVSTDNIDEADNKHVTGGEEDEEEVPPALPASPPPSADSPSENSSVPILSDNSCITLPSVKPQTALATIETQVSKPSATTEQQVLLPPSAVPQVSLPTSDPQVSFLHQLTSGSKFKSREKPKVPAKPVSIASKKPQFRVFSPRPKSPSLETFLDSPHEPLSESLSDSAKKRPAPKPPSPKSEGATLRSALSSDDLLNMSHCSNNPLGNASEVNVPVPRRSLSLSQDCLLDSGVSEMQGKKKNRGRFSLRKLLHIGKTKEGAKESGRREYRIAVFENAPSPAPRSKLKPEIIHPLDLTGAQVEVMPSQRIIKTRRTSSSASSSSGEHRESDIPSDSSTSQSVSSSSNSTVDALVTLERVRKPPPPPRGQMLDQTDKPIRPPPPKSAAAPEKQTSLSSPQPKENCYANIGEVRTGLAPSKPVRTGSLREVDVVKKLVAASGTDDLHSKKHYWTGSLRGPPKCPPIAPPEDSGYESFDISLTTASSQTSSLTAEENLYECVQTPDNNAAASESCMLRNIRQNCRSDRRSEGSVADPSHDYIKFRFLRSISMPYCASEAESEIYSPYSFCGSEMGEEDYEWSPTSGRFQKVSRLKMKKGRSIVHKNLEDNYGAVVVANHEALTQVVEQMHPGGVTSPLLRPLVSAHNLRWADFTIIKESVGVFVGHRAFYPALWGVHAVTVCVAPAQSVGSLQGKPPFNFNPLTELHDLVPACFLNDADPEDTTLIQCLISVLSRVQIEPIGTYCNSARNTHFSDELKKEVHFTLLQTINALKTLQASGIEEAPRELNNVVVCREERDPYPRVCMLPNSTAETASLCSCLLTILEDLPSTELSSLLKTTLTAEKAVSLSQAKALLEFTLWGPTDITFSGCSRGGALQRWLDLERASVLHGLVRTRADLSVFEENHLLFLVHTNAKVLADASVLLDAQTADC